MTKFYIWKGNRCTYELYPQKEDVTTRASLLLIHPVGVGLSKYFWHRFCSLWQSENLPNSISYLDITEKT